jgi:kynurenine formamidase
VDAAITGDEVTAALGPLVPFPSEEELDRIYDEVNNARRWGDDDELGTLNYITPAIRLAAVASVQHGEVVSIGFDLDTQESPKNPDPVRHTMRLSPTTGPYSAVDEVTVAPHGYAITHLDAVAHVFRGQDAYNGRLASAVCLVPGLAFGSVYAQREGIVTRGVLLDVAGALGQRWLSPAQPIGIKELEAAERYGDVTVGQGDAVFVRVGLGAREVEQGPEDLSERAGLMPECVLWLHGRRVAVYSGDCGEKIPAPYGRRYALPLHCIGLAGMGLTILDCPDMEALRRACSTYGSSCFLFTCSPLRLRGGTGSAVNPLCVF